MIDEMNRQTTIKGSILLGSEEHIPLGSNQMAIPTNKCSQTNTLN
jgi:hypothetical protein